MYVNVLLRTAHFLTLFAGQPEGWRDSVGRSSQEMCKKNVQKNEKN